MGRSRCAAFFVWRRTIRWPPRQLRSAAPVCHPQRSQPVVPGSPILSLSVPRPSSSSVLSFRHPRVSRFVILGSLISSSSALSFRHPRLSRFVILGSLISSSSALSFRHPRLSHFVILGSLISSSSGLTRGSIPRPFQTRSRWHYAVDPRLKGEDDERWGLRELSSPVSLLVAGSERRARPVARPQSQSDRGR